MNVTKNYTLNIGGRLFALDGVQVMGILNATPDSFYSGSRMLTDPDPGRQYEVMCQRVRQITDEGGTMIDVGACSTRPGAPAVSAQEEIERLTPALKACREVAPGVPVSVDTYRADVAQWAVEEGGAHIINDISGGEMDRQMFRTVARLHVPYILMHMQGTPEVMQQDPTYDDVTHDVILYLARRAQMLREMGVNDIIADPGFGFGKTVAHNYQMMQQLPCFAELDMPLLVGISRKSMIYRLTDGTPETALPGTAALNLWSCLNGAHILRVHDVQAATDIVKISTVLGADYGHAPTNPQTH